MRSHAAYLSAIELVTSGQFAEAQMVLRGALENAMYCFNISDKPEFKHVWFDKYKDGKDGSAFRNFTNRFSIKNIGTRMKEVSLGVGHRCDHIYMNLIDYGAHPNEKTFSKLATTEQDKAEITISVIALAIDHIKELLDTTIDVGLLLLDIFELAMPACTAAPPTSLLSQETIAERAYWLWHEDGRRSDRKLDHWLRAEADLRTEV